MSQLTTSLFEEQVNNASPIDKSPISSNDSRLSNNLPAPSPPSPLKRKHLKKSPSSNNRPLHPHLLFLVYPPCPVEVEPDPAELISNNSGSDPEDIDIKDQGTKFGTPRKPMFSLFDVNNLWFKRIIKQICRARSTSSEQYLK